MAESGALEESRVHAGEIGRQIQALRTGSTVAYRERLADRLVFLMTAMEDEGEEWREGSVESLRQMLSFLGDWPSFAYPTVGVAPDGTFVAQWQAGKEVHFSIDFFPDGGVAFVVFCPDPHHPDRVQRVSGTTSRDSLMDVVAPYQVHRWAAHAGT